MTGLKSSTNLFYLAACVFLVILGDLDKVSSHNISLYLDTLNALICSGVLISRTVLTVEGIAFLSNEWDRPTIEIYNVDGENDKKIVCALKAKSGNKVKNTCWIKELNETVLKFSTIAMETSHNKTLLRACSTDQNANTICSEDLPLPNIYEPIIHLFSNGKELYNISSTTIVPVKESSLNLLFEVTNYLNTTKLVMEIEGEVTSHHHSISFRRDITSSGELLVKLKVMACDYLLLTHTVKFQLDPEISENTKVFSIVILLITLVTCIIFCAVCIACRTRIQGYITRCRNRNGSEDPHSENEVFEI